MISAHGVLEPALPKDFIYFEAPLLAWGRGVAFCFQIYFPNTILGMCEMIWDNIKYKTICFCVGK